MRALLLVAHGSPDPEWSLSPHAVLGRIRSLRPELRVALGFLSPPGALELALDELVEAGAAHIEIVALMMSSGGRHLKSDLPEFVAAARRARPKLRLELRPGALGEHADVVEALAQAALID